MCNVCVLGYSEIPGTKNVYKRTKVLVAIGYRQILYFKIAALHGGETSGTTSQNP